MKKYLFFFFILILPTFLCAQRFAYIDKDLILERVPLYKKYKKEIENKISFYEGKIKKELEILKKTQKEFEEEKIFLLKEQIEEREQNIKKLKEKIEKLKTQYFHPEEGEIFNLQKKLLKPIKDQILLATQSIAKERKFTFVFDKKQFLVINDQDSKFDLTSQVLKKLNIK